MAAATRSRRKRSGRRGVRRLTESVPLWNAVPHHGGVDRVTLGARAEQLGHHVEVVHRGKRFALVCSCGVASTTRMKRMTAFDLITEHLTTVVRDGVSLPETVGTRS